MDFKAMNDTKVLITGSSGFVGQYLSNRLIEVGATVYGIDRYKSQVTSRESYRKDELTYLSANLRDISSLARAIEKSEAEYIIHLAAQSFVPESFTNPTDTIETNVIGTSNLLEAMRHKDSDARIVFAGTSEEYGLVFYSQQQYENMKQKYGCIFPAPTKIPEIPITELNPLRPMSPYAVSKVSGDFMIRNYCHSYGLKGIVSRAFNHEGAGRGDRFVTSTITRQVMQIKFGERDELIIGNVSACRDWSHVSDIVNGYILLAMKGRAGEVYNQGSQRTNSVLSYILLSLRSAGFHPLSFSSMKGSIEVDDPSCMSVEKRFGFEFPITKVDQLLFDDELNLKLSNEGLKIKTSERPIMVRFNPYRYRPSDVPLLMSDCSKIAPLGFKIESSLQDIVTDQLDHYLDARNRDKLVSKS